MGLGNEWLDHGPVKLALQKQAIAESLRRGSAMNAELLAAAERSLRKAPRAKRVGGFDSKLERDRYEYHMERVRAGLIAAVLRQPRFYLTDAEERPLIYTADLLVIGVEEMGGGHALTVEETKGSKRAKNARDSRTRFRVAADRNRWARWLWVEREHGVWTEEEL